MRRVVAVHRAGSWPEAKARSSATLAYLDRYRRRFRLKDDAGEPFLLDLAQAVQLGEGDGLELEGGGFIRVHAAAEEVVDISCDDAASLARIAWHLGNRHLPVQILASGIRIRDDHVIVAMLEGLGARVRRLRAPFDPEGGAYAGEGTGHVHDHGHHHH
jgi:urease accessory protein